MRYSHQRQTVLDMLKNVKTHPTADTVYIEARKTDPNISLGTVYRNLKQLEDNGDIVALYTDDGKVHYDGQRERHSHFICKNCKKIIDIFVSQSIPFELDEMGLKVESEQTVYYGLCKDCSK